MSKTKVNAVNGSMDSLGMIEAVEVDLAKIRRQAYAEGYAAARGDDLGERMSRGSRRNKSTLTKGAVTPQSLRDEIVARAKADIEELKDTAGALTGREGYLTPTILCDAEFIINKSGREVECFLRAQLSRNIHDKGLAKCAPGECFNTHIGKAIALRRALGKDVPKEYLNAPQPTEPRVGDVIQAYYHDGRPMKPFRVEGFHEGGHNRLIDLVNGIPTMYTPFTPAEGDKVIDDSREGIH